MKKSKLRLTELKVKSFTVSIADDKLLTVKGGKETTPDNTPLTSKDKPIDLPATGLFCPTQGINWCPL